MCIPACGSFVWLLASSLVPPVCVCLLSERWVVCLIDCVVVSDGFVRVCANVLFASLLCRSVLVCVVSFCSVMRRCVCRAMLCPVL